MRTYRGPLRCSALVCGVDRGKVKRCRYWQYKNSLLELMYTLRFFAELGMTIVALLTITLWITLWCHFESSKGGGFRVKPRNDILAWLTCLFGMKCLLGMTCLLGWHICSGDFSARECILVLDDILSVALSFYWWFLALRGIILWREDLCAVK